MRFAAVSITSALVGVCLATPVAQPALEKRYGPQVNWVDVSGNHYIETYEIDVCSKSQPLTRGVFGMY